VTQRDDDVPIFDCTSFAGLSEPDPSEKENGEPSPEEEAPPLSEQVEEQEAEALAERGRRLIDTHYGRAKGWPQAKTVWRGREVSFDEYYRLKRRAGPWCNRAVAHHTSSPQLGQMVPLEPAAIVDAPAWLAAMESDIVQVQEWNERSIVSEYTNRIARGNADSVYIRQPSYHAKRPNRWNADKYERRKSKERIYAKRNPLPKPDRYFPEFIRGRLCIELKRPIALAEWREWDVRANTPSEEASQTERDKPRGGWTKLADLAATLVPAQEPDDPGRAALYAALGVLNDRQRRVFEARRLSDEPMSLDDLAAELGVTKQRVHQIEERAVEKVEKAMKSRGAAVSAS
jgi:RNA polymerase sigma factor (sigma-70 family)